MCKFNLLIIVNFLKNGSEWKGLIKGDTSGKSCTDMCRSYEGYPKKWCQIHEPANDTWWKWEMCTIPGWL